MYVRISKFFSSFFMGENINDNNTLKDLQILIHRLNQVLFYLKN